MESTLKEIYDIKKIDEEYRIADTDGDLHEPCIFSGYTREWKYTLPTFEKRWSLKFNEDYAPKNINHFKNIFYKKYPALNGFPMENTCIAGGAVMNILTGNSYLSGDVDIFVHGLKTEAELNNYLKNTLTHFDKYEVLNTLKLGLFRVVDEDAHVKRLAILTSMKKNKGKINTKYGTIGNIELIAYTDTKCRIRRIWQREFDGNVITCTTEYDLIFTQGLDKDVSRRTFTYYRTKNAITITMSGGHMFQIIFRGYRNISEILHGFDLGSSAVGFDGEHVYATSRGNHSLTYMVNVIDGDRRSTTYEHRLLKYAKRGFRIVAPHFNTDALKSASASETRFTINLPYMKFTYPVWHLRSSVSSCPNRIYYYRGEAVGKEKSDYCPNLSYIADGLGDGVIIGPSARKIIESIRTDSITAKEIEDQMIYTGKGIPDDSLPIDGSDIEACMRGIEHSVINHGRLDVDLIKKYITTESPKTVTEKLVSEMFMPDGSPKGYLRSLFKSETDILQTRFAKLSKDIDTSVHWKMDEPGSQIQGSFNPIIGDISEWYGKYFNPELPTPIVLASIIASLAIEEEAIEEEAIKADKPAPLCGGGSGTMPPPIEEKPLPPAEYASLDDMIRTLSGSKTITPEKRALILEMLALM